MMKRLQNDSRPVMVFNATILALGFHSGLYNASLNVLMGFLRRGDFQVRLLFFASPSIGDKEIEAVYRELSLGDLPYLSENRTFRLIKPLYRYERYENWLNAKIQNGSRGVLWKRIAAQMLRPLRKIVHYQTVRYGAMEQNARNRFYESCQIYFDPIYPARGRFYNDPAVLRYQILHDATPHVLVEFFPESKRQVDWYADSIRSFQTRLIHYFANSQSTKKDFLRFAPGARPEQIDVTLLAADRELFQPRTAPEEIVQLKRKYGIPETSRYVFSLCSLEIHKNLLMTVETFFRLVREKGLVDLVLVLGGGTATGNQEIRNRLLELQKTTDRIFVTGYLPKEDLPVFYSHAEFFVFDSLYEGFGLPLLEAMQCGCPVISSNSSSMPEVVGDAGLLVDPKSSDELFRAMSEYLDQTELRAEYKTRALERSRLFSWDKTVEQMTERILADFARLPMRKNPAAECPVLPPLPLRVCTKLLSVFLPGFGRIPQSPLAEFTEKFDHLDCINPEKLDRYMRRHPPLRVNRSARPKRLIVSMTSFPQRCHDIHYAVYSLLRQTVRPDKIVLYLGDEKFPNREKDLPETLLQFRKYGLEFRWVKDRKAFTKLIYALQEFPEDIIVTADDDIYYRPDWLEKLYDEYLKDPATTDVIAHRCHIVGLDGERQLRPYKEWLRETGESLPSYRNFLTGVGGVLYPPHCLHPDVTDIELAWEYTPLNDDIWYYFMALRLKHRIRAVRGGYPVSIFVNAKRELRMTDEVTLAMQNVEDNANDVQFRKLLDRYPELWDLLNH